MRMLVVEIEQHSWGLLSQDRQLDQSDLHHLAIYPDSTMRSKSGHILDFGS